MTNVIMCGELVKSIKGNKQVMNSQDGDDCVATSLSSPDKDHEVIIVSRALTKSQHELWCCRLASQVKILFEADTCLNFLLSLTVCRKQDGRITA